jgi:anti-anti-sigma regulatory factor
MSEVKIVHISGSLHFANKNHLEKKLSNILDLHALPPKVVVVTNEGVDRPSTNSRVRFQIVCSCSILDLLFWQNVVLDMSGVSFIDPSAADAMSGIRDEISKKLDGRLYVACCPCN